MSYFIIIIILTFAIFWCKFVDQAFIFRNRTIYKVPSGGIALTFDDGPHPIWTPKILNILDYHGVQATFFLVGSQAERYPELVKQISGLGHEIGNHSYNHRPLWLLNKRAFFNDIQRTQDIIKNITGSYPVLIRPPKGILRDSQKEILEKLKFKITLWSVNSKDWCYRSSKKIVTNILKSISNGDIILLHDGGGVLFPIKGNRLATVEALDILIPELKSKGYEIKKINVT